MELVVFVAFLKFFFVEGGAQFIIGIQTAKKIGLKATLKITIAGVFFAVILFFLLFYSRSLISTRWLELALGITLYFFAASMFKEVLEKEHEEKEFDEKVHKYGYVTIVSIESVENATVLAALTFIDISGALVGVNSKR
jgi:high-affinity Fe2+/Pb2+ permease